MNARNGLLSALLAGLIGSGLHAGDWPRFRGPGGSGVSDETGLPVKWSKTEGFRWKLDLPGKGLSSPVIIGNRLYLTACTGWEQKRLHVLCYDARTGEQRWHRQVAATGPTKCNRVTTMAAPTPVADENRVFTLFGTGDLAAFDKEGHLLWYRSLLKDYPTIGNNMGMAASLALHEDVLFVPMENVGESFHAGIDARTGRNLWRHPRRSRISWTTPIVVSQGGRTEVIFQSPGELNAYDPLSGSKLWSYRGGFSSQPSPVAGDGIIFAPGGNSAAVRPGATESRKLWDSRRVASDSASPVLHQGRVYTVGKGGIVACADAKSGEVVWKHRTKGRYFGSLLIAENRLYLVNQEGVTYVLQLGDEPKELSKNELGEKIYSTPAVAHGAIYLRSDSTLYCIGAKK